MDMSSLDMLLQQHKDTQTSLFPPIVRRNRISVAKLLRFSTKAKLLRISKVPLKNRIGIFEGIITNLEN